MKKETSAVLAVFLAFVLFLGACGGNALPETGSPMPGFWEGNVFTSEYLGFQFTMPELKETVANNQLSSFRKRFEKYNLVILDELGYVSMDKSGCEMLFNLISSRNEKGSIIVNSNLSFERWEEVFKDPTLTGALIDRLAHKAHLLDISREKGGRFEETIAWLDSKR